MDIKALFEILSVSLLGALGAGGITALILKIAKIRANRHQPIEVDSNLTIFPQRETVVVSGVACVLLSGIVSIPSNSIVSPHAGTGTATTNKIVLSMGRE